MVFHRQIYDFRLTASQLMSIHPATFYEKTRDAHKIIVVDLGFLGDTLHLLPALHELKRNYSRAKLHVLTSPVGCEVLGLASCVDRAWALEMAPRKRTLTQQWQALRALRSEGFDVAINFSGADRTIFMTAFTGARWRVAYQGGRSHFWNRWLVPFWIPFIEPSGPVFERRREMLKLCGISLGPPRFELSIPKSAQEWAATQVPDGAIHFSVNASTHLKEWPLEHWIELGKRFSRRSQLAVLATGSENPRERSRLEAFASALKDSRVQIFSGLSIARLAALLSRCALHVGADSGVLHLAMALGLPTISLFREYPSLRGWLPQGPQHRSFVLKCGGRNDGPCQKLPAALCLKDLSPDAVAKALMETLESRAAHPLATKDPNG
jgi:ADP-heptose:LPS heptosyltransferase